MTVDDDITVPTSGDQPQQKTKVGHRTGETQEKMKTERKVTQTQALVQIHEKIKACS